MLRAVRDSEGLRTATPEMAEVAAKLLYLSMRPLTEYWMGVDQAQVAHQVLSRLFQRRRNLFSHEFAEYAQVDGAVAGLVLSYPATTMTALEPRTVLQYVGAAGLANTARMVWRSFPLQSIAEAAPDEYFLAHLAVLPEHEGRGLGGRMLQSAVEKARQAGLPKIALTVDAANDRAIRLYSRAGFEITGTVELEHLPPQVQLPRLSPHEQSAGLRHGGRVPAAMG